MTDVNKSDLSALLDEEDTPEAKAEARAQATEAMTMLFDVFQQHQMRPRTAAEFFVMAARLPNPASTEKLISIAAILEDMDMYVMPSHVVAIAGCWFFGLINVSMTTLEEIEAGFGKLTERYPVFVHTPQLDLPEDASAARMKQMTELMTDLTEALGEHPGV